MIKTVLRVLLLVVVVGVISYFALAFSASSSCSCVEANQLPALEKPYHLVTTVPPSLVYASREVQETVDRVWLGPPYYVKIDGEWRLREGKTGLMRDAYKEIKVTLVSD